MPEPNLHEEELKTWGARTGGWQHPSGGAAQARKHHGGEFDPGSGSTLAACLMHASRTGRFRAVTWRTGEEHVGNLARGGG